MSRKKSKNRCGGCENFDMADTWRTTYYGVFCEGTCKVTGKAVHNFHYACPNFIQGFVGKIF